MLAKMSTVEDYAAMCEQSEHRDLNCRRRARYQKLIGVPVELRHAFKTELRRVVVHGTDPVETVVARLLTNQAD